MDFPVLDCVSKMFFNEFGKIKKKKNVLCKV